MRLGLFALTIALLAACTSPSAKGTLTDVLAQKPIPGMRLIAEATSSTSLSCATFEATTDDNGAFSFDALCSGSAYLIKPGNENVWLAEDDTIPDGGAENLQLKAWMAPKGSGVYRLLDGKLEALKSSADIKSEPIWKSETEKAYYPAILPKKPALIPANGFLVLVGERAMKQTKFHPLIPSGERKFGSPTTTIITMNPWSYIGMEFKSDTEFEPKKAAVDTSKVITKEKGERKTSWIPGSALPAGRYAVHKDDDSRTTVIDFGAPPKDAASK